jgi:SAM-dependent methyltransferase
MPPPSCARPKESEFVTNAPGAPAASTAPVDRTATDVQPDAARLGNPSFVWRFGQERRLAMIERYVSLEDRRALDLGCGVGEYVRAFARQGADSIGLDVDPPRLAEARQRSIDGGWNRTQFLAGAGEALPFADSSLDVIVLNEVIEHVADDRATLCEVERVLTEEGRCVLFAPNRLYPFETHGIYFRKRYIFGNIPLVNWLPRPLRDRLVPHARVYGHGDWRRLIQGTNLEIVDHGYVFAGYDNVAARWPRVARIVRGVSYWAEGNILGRFGLSHLVVLRRRPGAAHAGGAS